jgi:hypothetical protein
MLPADPTPADWRNRTGATTGAIRTPIVMSNS